MKWRLLEQVFSGFPMGVGFQHFNTLLHTFTDIMVKKLFGNDLVGRLVQMPLLYCDI